MNVFGIISILHNLVWRTNAFIVTSSFFEMCDECEMKMKGVYTYNTKRHCLKPANVITSTTDCESWFHTSVTLLFIITNAMFEKTSL